MLSDSDIHEHDGFVESFWFVLRRCVYRVFSEPHVAGVGIPTHITHEWELFVPSNLEVAPVFRCYGKGAANSWCLMNYAGKFVAPVWGRWEHYENCRSHTVWNDQHTGVYCMTLYDYVTQLLGKSFGIENRDLCSMIFTQRSSGLETYEYWILYCIPYICILYI